MIRVHDVEQGTDEWHKLRQDKYTGANAYKLLRYGAIEYARTGQSDFKGSFYTKRGHILEDEALELYQRISRRIISRPGFVTNSEFPTCGYSPDAFDYQTLLEVKCFGESKHLGIVKGEVPFEVMAQVQFGLLICGLREAKLIIYNPDIEDPKLAYKIIPIKANKAVAANLKRILKKEREHALYT